MTNGISAYLLPGLLLMAAEMTGCQGGSGKEGGRHLVVQYHNVTTLQ